MIETGLQWLLSHQSTITARVGSRVFVGVADQKAQLPYITIENQSADYLLTLDGTSGKDELTDKDVDITAYGKSYLEAKGAAHAVARFLSDYTGAAGPDDDIDAVFLNDETDGYISPTDASAVGRYFTNLEFKIQHTPRA